MKNNYVSKFFISLVTFLIIFVCFYFFTTFKSRLNIASAQLNSHKTEKSQDKVKFFNDTRSFQLVDTNITNNEMILFLKNDYHKSINSFYITVGFEEDNINYDVELQYSEIKDEIFPNETFNFPVDLDEELFSSGLKIKAVLFTDGTADGDPNIIQIMRDQRAGEKTQLSKGLNILKNIKIASNTSTLDFNDLKTQINLLSTKEKSRSQDYNAGLSFGRDKLLHYLEQFEDKSSLSSTNFHEDFLRLQHKLENIIQKL